MARNFLYQTVNVLFLTLYSSTLLTFLNLQLQASSIVYTVSKRQVWSWERCVQDTVTVLYMSVSFPLNGSFYSQLYSG